MNSECQGGTRISILKHIYNPSFTRCPHALSPPYGIKYTGNLCLAPHFPSCQVGDWFEKGVQQHEAEGCGLNVPVI